MAPFSSLDCSPHHRVERGGSRSTSSADTRVVSLPRRQRLGFRRSKLALSQKRRFLASVTVVQAGREQFVEVSVKSLGRPPGTTNALCWLPLYLPRVKKAGMPRREKQETVKRAKSSDRPVCFVFATDQSANAQTGRAVTRECAEGAGFAGPRPSFKKFRRFWVGSAWQLTTTHQSRRCRLAGRDGGRARRMRVKTSTALLVLRRRSR
jgi:hypothetical protein